MARDEELLPAAYHDPEVRRAMAELAVTVTDRMESADARGALPQWIRHAARNSGDATEPLVLQPAEGDVEPFDGGHPGRPWPASGSLKVRRGTAVKVFVKVNERDAPGTKIFKGVVLKREQRGAKDIITIGKNSSKIGIKRAFDLNSPTISKIEVIPSSAVRGIRKFKSGLSSSAMASKTKSHKASSNS